MPGAMTPLTVSLFSRSVEFGIMEMYVASGVKLKRARRSYLAKVIPCSCNHPFINMNVISQKTITLLFSPLYKTRQFESIILQMIHSQYPNRCSIADIKAAQLALMGETRPELTHELLDIYHGPFPLWKRTLSCLSYIWVPYIHLPFNSSGDINLGQV